MAERGFFNWVVEDALGQIESTYSDLLQSDPTKASDFHNASEELKMNMIWLRKATDDFEKEILEHQSYVQILEAKHEEKVLELEARLEATHQETKLAL